MNCFAFNEHNQQLYTLIRRSLAMATLVIPSNHDCRTLGSRQSLKLFFILIRLSSHVQPRVFRYLALHDAKWILWKFLS